MEFPARDPAPQLPPRSADLLHEPLLRGLLEHASTMITVKDVHGRFLLVNPAFARAFGREPADLVGLSTRDVVPRSLAAAWSAHDHQVITSGVALQAPERFPGEQGKLVDCIATKFPLFGEDGSVVAIGSLRVEIGDLEAARDALEDSERRFQALFEQSAVGQIECDLRGRLTALNPTAVALLGLPAAPATVPAPTTVRTSIADVLTVPPGDDLHAQLRSVLTGPELQHHGLHHLVRPDGRRVAALVTATAVHGTGDGVRGALITLVDTSEQERAESQLLLSEQRSRSLLQSMPDAVVVVDAEGRIRDVNHQTETLFGYDAAELLGRPVEVLVPVGERRAHPARRSSYVAQADPQPMSTGSGIVGRRKDGSDVPVEISLAAVALEDGPAVIAAVRDVTATRALQQQLHDSEELFRLAFDRAPTGMALGGLRGADRGRFLRVNRALCRLTGYEEGDFLGRDAGFLNHPDDQRISREAVDGLAGGGSESFRAEKRYRHAEGHDVWVLVSASVVRDRDGTPSYTVVQVEDITARKRAEEALAQRARTTSVIASTLQRALLPYALVSPPGVELASRYRAAGDRSEIGGDWYDTVELPTGGLALIIGDVEGHDLTASSVMGMVRGAVRSYALEGHPPSVIVQQVNTFLFSTGIERLVTLGYLQLYPDDHLLTVTLAGHLAPLVVPQDGSPVVPLDVTPGLPLGVTPDAHWKEQTLLLPADVTLALYTDGLLEPASSPADPLARVLALAAGAARRGADDVADALLEDAPTYDDVAVLVARLTGAHSPQAARTLPAQAISAAIARLWVDDLLRLWEASGRLEAGLATSDRAETTQLLVTELVSNATRHSDRTVGLRAQLSGNRLRLDVSDSSHRMPVLRRPGLGETSGRGLALLDTLSTSWGVDLDEQGKRVWFELDLDAVEDLDAFEAFGGDEFGSDEFGGDEAELLAAFPDL